MIRVFATADWHESPEYHRFVQPSVEYFTKRVEEERPDLVAIPGDFFVKRGHLNPADTYHVRRWIRSIARVCAVVILPGNHDETHAVHGIDSVTGTFLPLEETHTNIHVFTKPEVRTITFPSHSEKTMDGIQLLVCPYPSRQLWSAGQEMDATEQHRVMGDLVGDMVRGLAEQLDPDLPSMFLFHGSIEYGKPGPEMFMTSEQEVVIRQVDLPEQATVCVGGHLHLPQAVGRFLYTGSPCAHTFSEERLEPSFLEVRLATSPLGAANPDWTDPNKGYEVTSKWHAAYKRHSIPVVSPMVTLDFRKEGLGMEPMATLQTLIAQNAAKIDKARTRLRFSIPVALRESINEKALEALLLNAGADAPRVMMETKPDILVRADEIHTGVTFQEGVNLWLKTQPDYLPLAEDLAKLVTDVEASLTPEQRAEMEPVDVRTVRIGWKNWKQHAEGTLDFRQLSGLTAIVGDNWAGKSNLAEIIPAVRWGALRNSLSTATSSGRTPFVTAVRKGQRSCVVWEEFEAKGSLFRIERSISVTASGNAGKSTLSLSEWRNEAWESVCGDDARETKREIIKLVGTLEHYLSTAYSAQRDLTRILDMGGADFENTLQDACNTQAWEYRKEVLSQLRDRVTRERDKAQGEQTVLRDTVEKHRNAAQELDSAQQRLANARAAAQAMTEQVEAAKTLLEQARREAAELPQLDEAITEAERKVEEAAESLATAKRQHEVAQRRVGEAQMAVKRAEDATAVIPGWEAKVHRLGNLETVQRMMITNRDKRDNLLRQAQELRREIVELAGRRQARLGQWHANRAGLQGKVVEAEREIERINDRREAERRTIQEQIAAAEKRTGLLEQVKDCTPPKRRLHFGSGPGGGDLVYQPALNEGCLFLQDAIGARDGLVGLRAALNSLAEPPEALGPAQNRLSGAQAALQGHDDAKPTDKPGDDEITQALVAAEIEAQARNIYDDGAYAINDAELRKIMAEKPREVLGSLQEAQKTLQERQQTLAEAQEHAQDLGGVVAARQAAVDAAQTTAGILRERRRSLAGVREKVTQAEQRVAALGVAETGARHEAEQAQMAVGAAQAQVAAKAEAEEALRAVDERHATLQHRLTCATVLWNACARSGVPRLILEQALPLLEQVANECLSDTPLQIRVASKGDAGLERTFVDDKGEYPISELSGAGRALLGLAMRWGLAVVASTFSGMKIRAYTFDEGFGAFHSTNHIVVQRFLRRITEADGVERVTVISHVPAVIEAADHILTVASQGDYSTVSGTGVAA